MEKLKKIAVPFTLSLLIVVIVSFLIVERHQYLEKLSFKSRTYTSEGLQAQKDIFVHKGLLFLEKLEAYWYDLKFSIKAPERAYKVAVAKIDDRSLDVYGRWPWDRMIFLDILKQLYSLGAKSVVFDAVFSEAEISRDYVNASFRQPLQGLDFTLQEHLKLDDSQVQLLVDRLPAIGDQFFVEALKLFPQTVLGYIWQDARFCNVYNPADPEWQAQTGGQNLTPREAAGAGLRHVEVLVDSLGSLAGQGLIVEGLPAFQQESKTFVNLMNCPIANRSAISSQATYQGYFNFLPDSDGIFRKYSSLFGFAVEKIPADERDFLPEPSPQWFENATFFPSLAVQALASYWGAKVIPELEQNKEGYLAMKGIRFQNDSGSDHFFETDPSGNIELNFYGSQKSSAWFANTPRLEKAPPILEISLADLSLNDVQSPEFANNFELNPSKPLDDFIVFIGPTSLGVYDIRPSPVQSDMAGVFLHATVASRMLAKAEGRDPHYRIRSLATSHILFLFWGFSLLSFLFVALLKASRGIPMAFVLILVAASIDYYMFSQQMLRLDFASIALGAFAVVAVTFLYKYFTEEKERAFVKGAFQKYVSPAVVESMLKDPKKLDLGGRKAHLSVLFSDIRGFTSISERMGASELADFLNDYLTPMSDIIIDHGGTIDKYMGDAIMAIFGAPVDMPDHAVRAVDSSISMLNKLKLMQAEWKKEDLPEIDVGIGINTGEMSVGNMGSKKIFSYTVMGDSVNLAARLEGINKEYATRLIVSEFTKNELPERFLCRLLDRVKVKGKNKPVAIYEVMDNKQNAELEKLAKRFSEALNLYFSANFTGAKAQFEVLSSEGDKTSAIFVGRCESFLKAPPPENWDGSWTMTTK